MKPILRNALRALVVVGASLTLVNAAEAQWHGHGGGYHHRGGGWGGPGWVWGGLGLGLGLGLASAYAAPYYYSPPTYVYTPPPTVVYTQPAATTVYSQPAPVPSSVATNVQPVIYPRNGQTSAQIGVDSDACSQWAGQQPNATSDRSVFNRAIAACMDARGYTLR